MPVVTEFWLQNNQFMDLLTVHKMYGILLVLVTGEHMLSICNRLKRHSVNIKNSCEHLSGNISNHSRNMILIPRAADPFRGDQ